MYMISSWIVASSTIMALIIYSPLGLAVGYYLVIIITIIIIGMILIIVTIAVIIILISPTRICLIMRWILY